MELRIACSIACSGGVEAYTILLTYLSVTSLSQLIATFTNNTVGQDEHPTLLSPVRSIVSIPTGILLRVNRLRDT
jgi:hypothetical protein